jgi:hypothetical protein
MKKRLVGFFVMLLLVQTAITVYGFFNNPPSDLTLNYDGYNFEHSFMAVALDKDGDKIRYGASWNNDENIDSWTSFFPSGQTVIIYAGYNITGTVGVVAEDEHGAQSEWSSVKSITKLIKTPFITFLENHPNLFPLLRQILGLKI